MPDFSLLNQEFGSKDLKLNFGLHLQLLPIHKLCFPRVTPRPRYDWEIETSAWCPRPHFRQTRFWFSLFSVSHCIQLSFTTLIGTILIVMLTDALWVCKTCLHHVSILQGRVFTVRSKDIIDRMIGFVVSKFLRENKKFLDCDVCRIAL